MHIALCYCLHNSGKCYQCHAVSYVYVYYYYSIMIGLTKKRCCSASASAPAREKNHRRFENSWTNIIYVSYICCTIT